MYKRMVDAHESKPCKVDPEVTLQFLKSAIYYFLTDKENTQGHLRAIESILGFSDKEKQNIDKCWNDKWTWNLAKLMKISRLREISSIRC